jgi:hypothetical protein
LTVIIALAGTLKIVATCQTFVDLHGALRIRHFVIEVAIKMISFALSEPDQI